MLMMMPITKLSVMQGFVSLQLSEAFALQLVQVPPWYRVITLSIYPKGAFPPKVSTIFVLKFFDSGQKLLFTHVPEWGKFPRIFFKWKSGTTLEFERRVSLRNLLLGFTWLFCGENTRSCRTC